MIAKLSKAARAAQHKAARTIEDDEKHRGETIAEFGDVEVYRRINRDHVQEMKEAITVGAIGAVVTFTLLKLYELTADEE